ncbi:hypothetical protein LCGC14_1004250 [marine sediment metagenome]|uniref:Uncharacterized protein n=1 Tax=marine sediment metagenome TaxID=412755 RepID=A0A0F9R890_9ZZZZ
MSNLYRVKVERVVHEFLEVRIDAESLEALTSMNAEQLERLVTHVDNTGWWDGDCLVEPRVTTIRRITAEDTPKDPIFRLLAEGE